MFRVLALIVIQTVAPYTGAWIEMQITVISQALALLSPPIRGRGLKLYHHE